MKRLPAVLAPQLFAREAEHREGGTWGRAVSLQVLLSPRMLAALTPAMFSLQMWHATQVASALPLALLLLPGFEPAVSPRRGGPVELCPFEQRQGAGLWQGQDGWTLAWP